MKHLLASSALLITFLSSTSTAVFAADPQKIIFGLISSSTVEDTKKRWQPLIDEMAAATKMEVNAVISTNYSEIVNGLKNNTIHIAWMGNKSALDAVVDGKVNVFAQFVNKDGTAGYSSVLITHKDSPITALGDVANKPGAYIYGDGDPKSTSGHLVPEFYVFARNKLDPEKHFKKIVVGTHQTNFMMVANKEVDLGTNNTNDLARLKKDFPEQFSKVRVFWTSPPIPSDPLLYRVDLSTALKGKIQDFFLNYGKQKSPAQLETLDKIHGLSGFRVSSNAQLDPIAKLESFSQTKAINNNPALSAEQKQKAIEEVNARLKKLEAVMANK